MALPPVARQLPQMTLSCNRETVCSFGYTAVVAAQEDGDRTDLGTMHGGLLFAQFPGAAASSA